MTKDPAAVALGRKGGLAKVPKGTAMLSEKERKARATAAAEARWNKAKAKKSARKAKKKKAAS